MGQALHLVYSCCRVVQCLFSFGVEAKEKERDLFERWEWRIQVWACGIDSGDADVDRRIFVAMWGRDIRSWVRGWRICLMRAMKDL